MKISVKVHAKSRKNQVLKKDERHYEVWVTEAPENGRANRAVLGALSEALQLPKSRLSVVVGQTSKNKIVAIE